MAEARMSQPSAAEAGAHGPLPVTVDNFTRAESDGYFAAFVKDGCFGRFQHKRALADIDRQTVVRMNRDTLYSHAVFDLDAGPVTVTLPDPGRRFMSLLAINEDHFNPVPTVYGPGRQRYTREQVGTRYLALLVRTFVDPNSPADLEAVHALQSAIAVEQPGGPGRFEIPDWEQASLAYVRNALKPLLGSNASDAFGAPGAVDPVHHLIATAGGWGGNPAADAVYISVAPARNDGTTVHRLSVRDVPVDAFWSVSLYNEDGFFVRNERNAYSINNVTATPEADGAYIIQFGGCSDGVTNCLPIMPGWNYTVRLYRPRREVIEDRWTFPAAQPVS